MPRESKISQNILLKYMKDWHLQKKTSETTSVSREEQALARGARNSWLYADALTT
jgi:hypothetical protein